MQGSNAPDFDPLNATADEEQEMMAGYLMAAGPGAMPDMASAAFEHGWRMRRNDRAGVVDDDQRKLAKRMAEIQAEADQRRRRLRGAMQGPAAKFKI